jgi:hypothetical protein
MYLIFVLITLYDIGRGVEEEEENKEKDNNDRG